MFARLAALILLALHVSAAEYTLYHRYAGNDYAPRGVVTVNGGSAKFEPSESSAQSATADTPWYQVALRVDGEYITASSPSCFVDRDATLTLHLAGDRPTGVEYKPAGPASGACPSGASTAYSLPSAPLQVLVKHASAVRSPPLAAPKVVDKTGQAVQPEPEKNFLQRYWLPIVGIMLVFAVLAGPDEPAKGGPRR